MEKKICSYETLFAINGNYSEEEYKAVCEKFVNLVNDNATDVCVNEWGKKRLAYPINYINEGYYVCVNFKSATDFPAELKRLLGINDSIIRAMVTVAAAKKAAPVVAEAAAEEAPAEDKAE